jgi:hypothetical protein
MFQLNYILAIKHEIINETIKMLSAGYLKCATSVRAPRLGTAPDVCSANISN